jgi:hypothetical protein
VGAKVRRSNEGRSASFKFSSSFLCRSAVFQKLAVAQRAGARLSLMEGRVWLRRRIGGGRRGGMDRLCDNSGAVESKQIEGVRR